MLLRSALTAGPYFWLQPLVTGFSAALVLAAAAATVRQRDRADRKEQWWKRTQWALELVLRPDQDAQVLGLEVLAQQIRAKVADREDAAVVADVLQPWVDFYQDA